MSRFPDIKVGEAWSQQKADEWNRVAEAAEAFANLTVSPPLEFRRIGRAAHLGIRQELVTRLLALTSTGAGIRFCKVVSLASEPDMVFIQLLTPTESGRALANDGDPHAALVWPNMVQGDFASFIGTNIILPVLTISKIPYVMQLPRWDIRMPSEDDPRGECPIG